MAMKVIMFSMVLGLLSCMPFYHQTNSVIQDGKESHDDYSLLLSQLLGIYPERFQFIDDAGINHPDELKLFKSLETIYGKHFDLLGRENVSEEELGESVKIIMFFSFYAQQHNSGAFNAYLASDLLPVYKENRSLFLDSMSDLPFLILSVCDRLNAFFGFEGENLHGKELFLQENMPYMNKRLSSEQKEACLAEFLE